MGPPRLHHGEPTADLPGQFGIAGQRRSLILPKIEVAARQRLQIRRLRHGPTIAKPTRGRRNNCAGRPVQDAAQHTCHPGPQAYYAALHEFAVRCQRMTPIPRRNLPAQLQSGGLIAMAEPAPSTDKAPITIKKYANRRLYNTATSSYVTLDHLCQMVKDGIDFVVFDAKTGEDITRSVLTQIIVEEESKGGQNLLPINFLRQL